MAKAADFRPPPQAPVALTMLAKARLCSSHAELRRLQNWGDGHELAEHFIDRRVGRPWPLLRQMLFHRAGSRRVRSRTSLDLIAWLASAENGIKDVYASIIHAHEGDFTDKLCVGDTCVTPEQFKAVFGRVQSAAAGATTALGGGAGAPDGSSAIAAADPATFTTSVTLVVNGNNPAQWQLNQPWQDNLGALFTHDGQNETVYSTSTVDVSAAGTTTIDYWAILPSTGEVLHATRDIVIPAPANEHISVAPLAATGTEATSSTQ